MNITNFTNVKNLLEETGRLTRKKVRAVEVKSKTRENQRQITGLILKIKGEGIRRKIYIPPQLLQKILDEAIVWYAREVERIQKEIAEL